MTQSPFINKKEWLEEYEYGTGIFYSESNDEKNYTSSEDNDSNWEESSSEEDKSSDCNMEELSTACSCCIVFSWFSLLFLHPILYYFFQAMRKGFSRVSMIQRSKSKQ